MHALRFPCSAASGVSTVTRNSSVGLVTCLSRSRTLNHQERDDSIFDSYFFRWITGWLFQIFFYLHPYLGKVPILPSIFFYGVETTNQIKIAMKIGLFEDVGTLLLMWKTIHCYVNQSVLCFVLCVFQVKSSFPKNAQDFVRRFLVCEQKKSLGCFWASVSAVGHKLPAYDLLNKKLKYWLNNLRLPKPCNSDFKKK